MNVHNTVDSNGVGGSLALRLFFPGLSLFPVRKYGLELEQLAEQIREKSRKVMSFIIYANTNGDFLNIPLLIRSPDPWHESCTFEAPAIEEQPTSPL